MVAPVAPGQRSLSLAGRRYPVVLPRLADHRLHVAAVVVSVQVLGQVALGFDLSIAQILVSLATCALLDVALTFWQRQIIIWPSSALLTGNGVALILRVPGTEHGDWWSLRGWNVFVAAAAVSLLSKYALVVAGRPLLNPSNVGLVVCFVVFGLQRADPQDLWWGQWSIGLGVTYAVILIGGITLAHRLDLWAIAVSSWVTLAAALAVLAVSGHAITTRWHLGPLGGWSYWWVVVTSPEVLIFVLFMITDPRSAVRGRVGGAVYGALVGLVAAVIASFQSTEFWTKVGILAALVVVCLGRPLLESVVPEPSSSADRLGAWLRRPVGPTLWGRPVGAAPLAGIVVAAAVGVLLVGTARADPGGSSASGPGRRPPVDLAADEVPEVGLAAGLGEVSGGLDGEVLDAMAHDLVEGLAILDQARRRGDPELASSAAVGDHLTRVQDEIAASHQQPGGRHVDRLEASIVRDPRSPQSPPQIALRAVGTFDGASTFDETYVLVRVGQHFLIADEV